VVLLTIRGVTAYSGITEDESCDWFGMSS